MKNVLIIFKKEMKDILRDRRTLLLMIVIPLLLFPIIINLTTSFITKLEKGAREKILNVSVVLNGNSPYILNILKEKKDMTLIQPGTEKEMREKVSREKLDFAIILDRDFDSQIKRMDPAVIRLYYRSSAKMDIAKRRIDKILKKYGDKILNERFARLNIDKRAVNTLNIDVRDVTSIREKFGERAGGFIPYLFVIFCFLGAMYPAIDLGAGEKERGTIETLLVSPATRLQIVMGKFWVVTAAGVISALLSLVGLIISIKINPAIPADILSIIMKIIDIKSVTVIFSLLLPLSIFFSGALLSLSIFAHSFKEAQSIITPLNFIVIIPAFIGTLPGIKLDAVTAVIPVLNVSLASKAVISGNASAILLFEVYISLIILASLSILFCVRWFNNEKVIFRES